MVASCHIETVIATHRLTIEQDPTWDMETGEWHQQEAIVRPPTEDEVRAMPDSLVYDIVSQARGITRAEVAFERFTSDRLGAPDCVSEALHAYWLALDRSNLPELPPFERSSTIRAHAELILGADLTNDVMRATCRMWPEMEAALEGAAIGALVAVSGLIDKFPDLVPPSTPS